MVFWKTYPIKNIIKRIQNKGAFTDLQFERENIESPTGYRYKILDRFDYNILKELQVYIKTYFGSYPILDIPNDKLLGEKDIILYVRDNTGIIAGCIRYHYLGTFISSNKEIYCEDCFCIHPKWRKKGVGDYLLTQLHIYVNKNNIPYSMFLKEGPPLSMINIPFYSGLYVYKKLEKIQESQHIINLSIQSAYKIIDIFKELNNNLFIIRNEKSNNQIWKLYKKDKYNILVCFQDTYQIFEENKKQQKIGWTTAWFESPNIPDNIREEASNILADSMYKEFDYIWMNRLWVNNYGKGTKWKIDGPFHWYLYQWATNISIKTNYCILN